MKGELWLSPSPAIPPGQGQRHHERGALRLVRRISSPVLLARACAEPWPRRTRGAIVLVEHAGRILGQPGYACPRPRSFTPPASWQGVRGRRGHSRERRRPRGHHRGHGARRSSRANATLRRAGRRSPFGRPGGDVARAVRFFLEPDSYVTGQVLTVDGGLTRAATGSPEPTQEEPRRPRSPPLLLACRCSPTTTRRRQRSSASSRASRWWSSRPTRDVGRLRRLPGAGHPLDLGKMSDRTRRAACPAGGDRIPVTKIKVKDDLIEFHRGRRVQLVQGRLEPISPHVTSKSSFERDLEAPRARREGLRRKRDHPARARRSAPQREYRDRQDRERADEIGEGAVGATASGPRHGLPVQHRFEKKDVPPPTRLPRW